MGAEELVAFCARTTSYRQLLHRVDWHRHGIGAKVISPQLDGRPGAQMLVPRALGEALSAYLRDELPRGWRSSHGVPFTVQPLP